MVKPKNTELRGEFKWCVQNQKPKHSKLMNSNCHISGFVQTFCDVEND